MASLSRAATLWHAQTPWCFEFRVLLFKWVRHVEADNSEPQTS